MRTTSQLPDWIRDYVPREAPNSERTDKYRNIYELIPDERQLYGTETLYGDWDAELLLLAQDFSSVAVVRQRVARGEERPYRHEPGLRTNESLRRLVDRTDCHKLYGSALVGLLRDYGDGISGTLKDKRQVVPYAVRVLAWVIEQMPRLAGIACLGNVAWEVASNPLLHSTLESRGVRLFKHAHPRMWPFDWQTSTDRWGSMCADLGIQFNAESGAIPVSPNDGLVAAGKPPMSHQRRGEGSPRISRRRGDPPPGDWPASGPTLRMKNFRPRPQQSFPTPGCGRWVALNALLRPQGATEEELWVIIRAECPATIWNCFDKVDEGYRVINGENGWGVFTDSRSGRTFAYRDEHDLESRLIAARDAGYAE